MKKIYDTEPKRVHFLTSPLWFKKVQAFKIKHDFKSLTDIIHQAVNKFMKEYK